MTKQSLETKFELVKEAILLQLKNEGVDLKSLETETINNITNGYMLIVQCIWYRLTDDKKIANLIVKFEKEAALGMSLLETHSFEDLVYTFRSIKTNLYQVSGGKGRKYNLSTKDYNEFLENVKNGTYQVISKQKVSAKSTKTKAKKAVSTKTSFLVSLVTKGNNEVTSKEVVEKATPKAVKVSAKSTKVEWLVLSKTQLLKQGFEKSLLIGKSIKVEMLGNLKYQGILQGIIQTSFDDNKNYTIFMNTKNESVQLDYSKIKKIFSKVDENEKVSAKSTKAKTKKTGTWQEIDIEDIKETPFLKLVLSDKTKVFAKFVKYDNDTIVMNHRTEGLISINISDIEQVFNYVK